MVATLRFAVADQLGADLPVRGLIDVAAALASSSWADSPVAVGAARLLEELRLVLDQTTTCRRLQLKSDDAVAALGVMLQDACHVGALLGYALARSADVAEQGWPAWLHAAEAHLRTAGSPVEPLTTYDVAIADELASARRAATSQLSPSQHLRALVGS